MVLLWLCREMSFRKQTPEKKKKESRHRRALGDVASGPQLTFQRSQKTRSHYYTGKSSASLKLFQSFKLLVKKQINTINKTKRRTPNVRVSERSTWAMPDTICAHLMSAMTLMTRERPASPGLGFSFCPSLSLPSLKSCLLQEVLHENVIHNCL